MFSEITHSEKKKLDIITIYLCRVYLRFSWLCK